MSRKTRKRNRAIRRAEARKAAEAQRWQIVKPKRIRGGYIPSAWRTRPVGRKMRADSRLRWEAHRNGPKLRAIGERGAAMLDMLDTLRQLGV
jgi:hypothetical protein